MGIRVNKLIGYGLTDIQYDKYTMTDPRIRTDSILFDWDNPDFEDAEAYLKFLETVDDGKFELQMYRTLSTVENLADKYKFNDPRHCFHWGPEYGMGNVLAIRDFTHVDSHRSADIIDWVEETYVGIDGSQVNWVRELPDGPFPHNGFFMDSETGNKFTKENYELALGFKRLTNYGEENDTLDVFRNSELSLVEKLGYSSFDEAYKRIVPNVPREIRNLCEFGKLFIDPSDVRLLRPIIYCWWS